MLVILTLAIRKKMDKRAEVIFIALYLPFIHAVNHIIDTAPDQLWLKIVNYFLIAFLNACITFSLPIAAM